MLQRDEFRSLARFQCFAAARLSFTWLVEWLHRRVIASAGAIARRLALVRCMRVRCLGRIFDIATDESQKSLVAK